MQQKSTPATLSRRAPPPVGLSQREPIPTTRLGGECVCECGVCVCVCVCVCCEAGGLHTCILSCVVVVWQVRVTGFHSSLCLNHRRAQQDQTVSVQTGEVSWHHYTHTHLYIQSLMG